jgi:hypothetical protein
VLRKSMFVLAFIVAITTLRTPNLAAQFGRQRTEQTEQERDMEQKRQKEANQKRQDEIREDTQKLYQLASQLKDAVDKTNEHVLSLDVVKKAEEVEKLAKKVKEKMREGVGKPITVEPAPTLPRPPFGPN